MDTIVIIAAIVTAISTAIGALIAREALLSSRRANLKTDKFHENQIALQKQANDLLLKREKCDAQDAKKADIIAKVVQVQGSHYQIEIYNQGRAEARNVKIEQSDPQNNLWDLELSIGKLCPMKNLFPKQATCLNASISSDHHRKETLTFFWEDDSGSQKKEIELVP